jgi:hypothetical protein
MAIDRFEDFWPFICSLGDEGFGRRQSATANDIAQL